MKDNVNISIEQLPLSLAQEIYSFIIANYDNNILEDRYSKIEIKNEATYQPALKKIKRDIKDKLAVDLGSALQYLKFFLDEDKDVFDDLIGLISRFNRIENDLHKGIIEYNLYDMEIIKIGNALLYMLKHLNESDIINPAIES